MTIIFFTSQNEVKHLTKKETGEDRQMVTEYVDINLLDVCSQRGGKKVIQAQAVETYQGLTHDQRRKGCENCVSIHRVACRASVGVQETKSSTIFCIDSQQFVPNGKSPTLLEPSEPQGGLVLCQIENQLLPQVVLWELFKRHGSGDNATCEKCRKCMTV